MRTRISCLVLILLLAANVATAQTSEPLYAGPSAELDRGPLRVSEDGRYLEHGDGTPFFWLGDTAWELFHRLDREEAALYLEDRRSKGFTVIQAVVLAELGGLRVPNRYGHIPLVDNDPTRPGEDYFQHVDHIVGLAAAKGMFIGLLPTWGDKFNQRWGEGPEIFTPANARVYGEFLARRYAHQPIVWILGGDRSPESEEHLAIIRAMAEGIEAGAGPEALITYHPMGHATSSTWFHEDPWLDFNMFQSGHGARDLANHEMTARDRALDPAKPVIDGEPRYEDHPVDWDPQQGWFDEFDVRQAAYWSLLSGAAGHTYGDHNIWQMWEPGREAISSARTPWRDAISHPGSRQMGLARGLLESRAFFRLEPAPDVLVGARGEGAGFQVAALAKDGSTLLAYTPLGAPLEVDVAGVRGASARVHWFDPRSGALAEVGVVETGGVHRFDPPGEEGRGNDWVLVIDAVDAGFNGPPGATPQ